MEKLPEDDFFFTLYSKEKITLLDRFKGFLNRKFGYFTPLVITFVLLLIIIILIFVVKKGCINKKNTL